MLFSLVNGLATATDLPMYGIRWTETNVLNPQHVQCRICAPCDSCSSGEYLQQLFPKIKMEDDETVDDELVAFKMWCKSETTGRLIRSNVTISKEEACKQFIDSLPKFVLHHHTKVVQYAAYNQCKQMASENHPIIQIDFAENYTCSFQDEIQSAHWNQGQVTVFTCCVWFAPNVVTSYVVISDCTDHNKDTAAAFLISILEIIMEEKQVNIMTELIIYINFLFGNGTFVHPLVSKIKIGIYLVK